MRVHTYLAKSGADDKTRKANQAEFARVAAETSGKAFTSDDTIKEGFQSLLEEVICASKQPTKTVQDCKCCRECMERRVVAAAKP